MHIVVYGKKEDYDACVFCLDSIPELQYRKLRYTHTDDYDSFIGFLGSCGVPDLIIVTVDGAEGMEGVMASKRLCGNVSVVWFSDDLNFGVQSMRLGCTFFGTKPITKQAVSTAISKYRQERIG